MDNVHECRPETDWVGNSRSFLLAWGLPTTAIVGGAFLDPSLRTVIWLIALVWMGVACALNARHCGRTHCRFTGPFYLLMTVPVLLYGLGIVSFGLYGWWWLGVFILFGTVVIWWATEAAWGKFWSAET